MSDKELLEFAAKAAGINGTYVENDDWYGTGIVYTDPDDCDQCWNPLTDDGDALRLAVKLGMCVTVFQNSEPLATMANTHIEEFNGDPYAATRRAIVRAAAEIGKAMP